jgi:hypothetical protein
MAADTSASAVWTLALVCSVASIGRGECQRRSRAGVRIARPGLTFVSRTAQRQIAANWQALQKTVFGVAP